MQKHNVNRDDLLLVTGKAKSLSSQPTCDAQHNRFMHMFRGGCFVIFSCVVTTIGFEAR